MPVQAIAQQFNDFTKLFSQFQMPGLSVDKLAAAQRRNLEALTAATQLTAESWQTVFSRQAEMLTQFVQEGSGPLQSLLTPGAPEDKLAQQAELVKATFEKGIANFREMSDILTKSNAEARDVLAKRVTESLTELNGTAKKAKTSPN